MRIDYFNFRGFENVYLEDSYVLAIMESSFSITFLLEAILNSDHLLYSTPKLNEKYYYRKAEISFTEVENSIWIEKNIISLTDAENETDLGNVDEFFFEDNFYHLSGDWGQLKIQSAKPTIGFIED